MLTLELFFFQERKNWLKPAKRSLANDRFREFFLPAIKQVKVIFEIKRSGQKGH
jgi:hypothetical protein